MTQSALRQRTNWPARLWPWLVAEGVIGILAGVLAVSYPHVTVVILALFLGFGLLIQGVFELLAAAGHAQGSHRMWLGVFGAISVVAGLIVLIHPGAGVFALIIGLAVWFFVTAFNELTLALTSAEHRIWNGVLGALTFIAAVVLLAQPDLAVSTVAFIAGFVFIVRGVLDLGLGLTLRKAVSRS